MAKAITMEELKKRLQARQYKMTPQRQIVLRVFIDHPNNHLSAEEVHLTLKQQSSEIGLATVYRSLELLSDLGILQKLDFGDGRSRYEVNAAQNKEHQHHHLICIECGSVQGFAEDLLETLEKDIADQCDFQVQDHQVKFFGYCRKCRVQRED